jgi:putative exporter of polyketide antibiotics
MTIKFMASYQTKPLYVFGGAGMLTLAFSVMCAVLAFLMKYANLPHHADFVQTPLPILAMVMLVLGIQFFLMGLLAEMQVRTYHESQSKAIYAVREKIGFASNDER